MNSNGYKLIVETPREDVEYIISEKNGNSPSTLYIQGPFLMANEKNRNGRIYLLEQMAKEVERYTNEMITTKRSLGELNHPTSVEVNPERACHIIESFEQQGNVWMGRSKVLTNTPMGKIVSALILDNVKLGVSSRSLGKLKQMDGYNEVEDFKIIAVDVVHDPSVNTAFVNGIFEAKEWILTDHGYIEPAYDTFTQKLKKLPNTSDAKAEHLIDAVTRFLYSL
jgi:hypothetical protein